MMEQNVISLGASHVSLAQFSGSRSNGVVLERAMRLPLDSDPGKREGWFPAVGAALDGIRVRFPLKGACAEHRQIL